MGWIDHDFQDEESVMKKFSLLLALALLSAGASAQFLVPVGQGTVQNTTSSYPAPYGQFY